MLRTLVETQVIGRGRTLDEKTDETSCTSQILHTFADGFIINPLQHIHAYQTREPSASPVPTRPRDKNRTSQFASHVNAIIRINWSSDFQGWASSWKYQSGAYGTLVFDHVLNSTEMGLSWTA